jgi:methionyl-tRNA formyltransferase
MKILYLGPKKENLIAHMEFVGDEVIQTEEILSPDSEFILGIDFIVSYGYRYIIKKPIIDLFQHKIINLHISLLPWNKGADPNLWSFLEDSPKGITIHYIDYGLDTGEILVQQEVAMDNSDTLRSSYNKLEIAMEGLFIDNWQRLKSGQINPTPQSSEGSIHRMKDRIKYEHFLFKGWDTPVSELIGRGLTID